MDEQVYLTKEQALNTVLGDGVAHVYESHPVSEKLNSALEERSLASDPMTTAHFFVGRNGEKTTGYALIDSEVGKHLPITYIVGISPKGDVTRVEVMVFREVQGWQVKERGFMQQFEGKTEHDELKIGKTVRNVSGATLSSRAIAKGVKRALFLWNEFYGAKDKLQ